MPLSTRLILGLSAVVVGVALGVVGALGEMRLTERRGHEESAVRRERERLRDEWVSASRQGVDDVLAGRQDDLGNQLATANAGWKRGVESAAERERSEFDVYAGERQWTLLALFTGVVTALAGATILALAWLRRRTTARSGSGLTAR